MSIITFNWSPIASHHIMIGGRYIINRSKKIKYRTDSKVLRISTYSIKFINYFQCLFVVECLSEQAIKHGHPKICVCTCFSVKLLHSLPCVKQKTLILVIMIDVVNDANH